MNKFDSVIPKYNRILHGGDYNPDQWKEYPGILEEDMRLMKLAGVNTVSIGIFSWATIEPEEGKFDFEFFDKVMDMLSENGIKAIFATPSGARPVWLAEKYPEVLRVNENGLKNSYGVRHNHCFTSPVYREKVRLINAKIAEHYKNHPALGAWHISNEYSGTCYCENCKKAFQNWLREKYDNDINKLNSQWWTAFWSHTYSSFEQINPPAFPMGDYVVHAHNLDWKRFISYQTIDFFKNEIAPLKEITPDLKVITNFMGTFPGLDYQEFAKEVDVVSWDAYPFWHKASPDTFTAADTAFIHNINRSLKDGQPFMLMESTPSKASWHPVNKLKRPGMHALSSLQAIAHGSDTVQYFQWRKCRGAWEKFHGAVVDHVGTEHTRVFKEVAELGNTLKKLSDIVGTHTISEVAVIYDWQNRWAIDDAQFLSKDNRNYHETCLNHYFPFWNNGINVDIISQQQDFSKYKLVIAPMLYLLKPQTKEKIAEYVKNGGTFVATYLLGEVNENDLCYLGGFPAEELKEVFGIWAEDIDSLYDHDFNTISCKNGKEYKAVDYCEIIHPSTAEVLAEYTLDFYAGMPAVTKNAYGKGTAYYIAFRSDNDFENDFYNSLINELNITKPITDLPDNVTCTTRTDGEYDYVFIMNFNNSETEITINDNIRTDILTGDVITGKIKLPPYGVQILKILKQS